MSRMIQIPHVPESLHRRLTERAAMAGMTLSDYLREELARIADQLTDVELRQRLDALPASTLAERPVDAVRKERDRR